MRLLIDMGLSPRVAEVLREAGHDVVHVRDRDGQTTPDVEILKTAQDERRVIVTFDLDFARLVALQRLVQPSVILFRLEGFRTPLLSEMLLDLASRYEAELTTGCLVVVDQRGERLRMLPIW